MVLSSESRRNAYDEDHRWAIKALLRLIACVFAFIAMCLFASAVSYTNANFDDLDDKGDWTDGLPLAPIVLSLLYNPVALLMNLIFRKGRHFSPAVGLTLDLIIWGLCVPSIVFSIGGGIFWYWTSAIPNSDGNVDCSFYFNQFSRDCSPLVYTIGNLEIAGIVGLVVLFIVHITLFIFAAIDLHRRRRAVHMGLSEKNSFEMAYNKDGQHPEYSP